MVAKVMDKLRQEKTISSALWAAYGDILGFPTELVDQAGVRRRIGKLRSERPESWKRLVGGRLGVQIDLPAGCYSDDTQLRLSTSRAIRADGYFDVESFAKIELPVWLSYSLGAGRGSKVGAASLSQRNANWFSNFFDQKDVIYTNGGGNGAAMRIQPHVWAASDLGNPATYLPEVIQNALCTHGHPRGIAGAVLHAVLLAHVLKNEEIPHPSDWKEFGSFISLSTELIEENPDLSTFWLPTWNTRTASQFAEEMERARMEWESDVNACQNLIQSGANVYAAIVENLGGLQAEQRGSGLKSALFSLLAAWLYRNLNPQDAISDVVNLLGSDTDTIGSMAGALLGAIYPHNIPEGPIQDMEYIKTEATRIFKISQEIETSSFTYPDLMQWQPPKTQLDVVGLNQAGLLVAGLGLAKPISEEYVSPRSEASWQWLQLAFGQRILCKRRSNASLVHTENYAAKYELNGKRIKLSSADNERSANRKLAAESDLFRKSDEGASADVAIDRESNQDFFKDRWVKSVAPELARVPTLNEITDEAIRSGFNERVIGAQLLRFAEEPDGLEKAVGYAAVIVKARAARLKRNG